MRKFTPENKTRVNRYILPNYPLYLWDSESWMAERESSSVKSQKVFTRDGDAAASPPEHMHRSENYGDLKLETAQPAGASDIPRSKEIEMDSASTSLSHCQTLTHSCSHPTLLRDSASSSKKHLDKSTCFRYVGKKNLNPRQKPKFSNLKLGSLNLDLGSETKVAGC